ncbi:hydroxymethylglutaryl-CoA lyase [Flammeovirga yaeyamensis]|uniref:Hydroxymethylglutaryl-CoA lyase n=1 Tax=Flammeovirga yaeyamensis TaxID=367791 RepID=A0AAX1NA73_9BACT|nr:MULTISPECIES: hydroxymethylglutaryl-CoA lyase [Flammeovirga]ANQ49213.1 hydroxymethylglutaryl-CoA lyase [Flammeovirga sp. MY04]MBB3697924.1 hydroxymethylglutaryl-CoA lyase [Flammeovirga yaeyamensis]NMF35721.1 hydroxymethylglutaryl-CoA lyase [Flammeovirga yaeyamensis]QWG03326.1 hydroxymethylglutaryl-CoA lyase [Flammeovirga yaeyamensis]
MNQNNINIIECPRDAMQGLSTFIPTQTKIDYINQLLKVGFHTLDFGSFVSPKAIPQMKDTREVLDGLDLSETSTKLLAIIANLRGAQEAVSYDQISYLGFPLSVSEIFQRRNTNSSISEALWNLKEIVTLCKRHRKEAVVYLSMSFGNPYGEYVPTTKVLDLAVQLREMGVKIISLADTIGAATLKDVEHMFENASKVLSDTELGVHLHCHPSDAYSFAKTAIDVGCKRIDAALGGLGGCPMAKDDLTGNLATESLIKALSDSNSIESNLNLEQLDLANEFRKKYIG